MELDRGGGHGGGGDGGRGPAGQRRLQLRHFSLQSRYASFQVGAGRQLSTLADGRHDLVGELPDPGVVHGSILPELDGVDDTQDGGIDRGQSLV